MRKKLVSLVATLATAAAVLGIGTSAAALPESPDPVAPVTGIPAPCAPTHPWPGDDAGIEEIRAGITKNFGFRLTGPQWTDANRESIRILWETLDGIGCTTYLADLQAKAGGHVGLNAGRISGFAWGDWSLTKGGYVTLDFSKFTRAIESGDKGRLTRLVVHELAHVWNSDRDSNPGYWKAFKRLYAAEGKFSDYGARSVTETFGDVVGYYVGRCADNNPYDTGRFAAYYAFVRDNVFGGREFGPAPGVAPSCEVPAAAAAATAPTSWIQAVAGE